MRACAERIATAPSDDIRILLGKQVGDESKHVRIQHEWMEKFGTDRSPVFAERQQEMFLQHFRSLNWLDFLDDTLHGLGVDTPAMFAAVGADYQKLVNTVLERRGEILRSLSLPKAA